MKLTWATDIHLDHANSTTVNAFFEALRDSESDGILLTGDIAESQTVVPYLENMLRVVNKPIYFVLGNHDYYGGRGGIFPTREETRDACSIANVSRDLVYLTQGGVVELTAGKSVLIGHDGWYDGGYADFLKSSIQLNDFNYIRGLAWEPKNLALKTVVRFAEESAKYITETGDRLLETYETLVVATHVPPFRACATYMGVESDNNWAPWMTSKAMGDALLALASKHQTKKVEVFCGHSHGRSDVQVLPNLRVRTGGARYKYPEIQSVIEF